MSPFHEGEKKAQLLAHEERAAERNGSMISSRIPAGAFSFLRQQSMAVVGTEDAQGGLWCSLLFGEPGFLVPDSTALTISLSALVRQPADPLWTNLASRARAGVLVIELESRRRIRINGNLRLLGEHLSLNVTEAFPNCSKYITRRHMRRTALSLAPGDATAGQTLNPEQILTVQRADALFLTTSHPEKGLDTSHRGGLPGFIEVVNGSTLRVPDYSGNSMFNSFGNLLANPAAAILIPDFERRVTLQLSGTAEIDWQDATAFGGTHRSWTFHIRRALELPLPLGIDAEVLDYSSFDPPVAAAR